MGGGRSYQRRWLFIVCLCGALALPSGAYGYTFGPGVTGLGPEETVFDWTTEKCEEWDIPDQPARAFKDDQGRVQLQFTATEPRRNIGPDLNAASSLGHHDCTVTSWSQRNPDPSQYDAYSWVSAPYTLDGRTIYSLVHHEHRAWNHGTCTPPGGDTTKCWYNAITLETSTNSGDLFTHTAAPTHLVASMPYRWVDQTGHYGLFTPSNIIKKQPDDGYYYSIIRSKPPDSFDRSCLIRTQNLADPTSWRAWGGSEFTVRFINPYLETPANPADHICQGIGLGTLSGASDSLTYNTHFGKYMVVNAYGGAVPGLYYSLSDDLVNWTPRRLLLQRETLQSWQCGDPDPIRDASLLDPASTSRNFETTGRRVYLYYKIFRLNGGCSLGPDRDQLRVPIEFDPAPSNLPPTASFTVSPNPALTGQSVSFNGSASSDPDGSIANYKWDLDGDGTFETDSGSSVAVSRSYTSAGSITVKLRVTDNGGTTNDTTRTLTVNSSPPPPNQPPSASFTVSPNPAQTGQNVSFNGSASSDPDGSITNYRWDLDGDGTFETDTGSTATTSRSYSTAGTVTVGLRVTDSNGAMNDAGRTLTITTAPPTNQSPIASFTIAPNPALLGQSVSFNGSTSRDPDGSIASYKWDLDGNGTFETTTGTTATTSRSYTTAGTVTVRLRVTDNGANTNDAIHTLTVNVPPSASFILSPNPALTGQSVSFNGSASSDPDGSIADYQWDLDGNGTFETYTGSTATTSRSYTTAGTVTVKLRVTDNRGATNDTSRALTTNGPPSTSQTPFPPAWPAPIQASPPTVQPAGQAPKPQCASARERRARLTRKLRSVRRKLARAKTSPAKRLYRRQIRSLNRKLKRLRSTACPR